MELLGRYSKLANWADLFARVRQSRQSGRSDVPTKRGIVRRLSDEQVAELIDRYRAGASINDLAGHFKIHRTTASLHLLRQGVRGRRRTEALLDRFEVAEPQRTELLTRRRAVSVTISHPEHGRRQ